MTGVPTWEKRRLHCPEAGRLAELLVAWSVEDGRRTLQGVACDNPALQDLSGWSCRWSCWRELEAQAAGEAGPAPPTGS